MDDQSDASTEMQTRRKAEAGVGKRGQKLKDHHGPLATPAKALFRAEQQLIFMQVEQALRMHEIQYGYPKTHSEFMEKIIEPNRIVLPELPAGQRYEFDTTTHQLMVVTEANADQSP